MGNGDVAPRILYLRTESALVVSFTHPGYYSPLPPFSTQYLRLFLHVTRGYLICI
jgi:hypothetical protein